LGLIYRSGRLSVGRGLKYSPLASRDRRPRKLTSGLLDPAKAANEGRGERRQEGEGGGRGCVATVEVAAVAVVAADLTAAGASRKP